MKSLILIFNIPPYYRKEIYKKIDSKWDCKWFFSSINSDVKCFDSSILKNVKNTTTKYLLGGFSWQTGIVSLFKKNKTSNFLILGEPYNISIWILSLFIRIFNPSCKIYFWSHGWYGRESKIKKFIKKLFFRLPHKTFLYGNYAKDLMVKEGFKAENLVVIHNSLDYDQQLLLRNQCKNSDIYKKHFGNDYPVIIFIGRLTEVKKIEQLLLATKKLKEEEFPINIILVGSGEKEKELKNLSKDLKLENQVWFFGASYDEKTNAELIYNADLCVAPGNVGLTAIHSMMFGTPVLTHNDFKWQMPEFEAIINGVTGTFFEKDNIKSLSKSILSWFNNENNNRDVIRENCFKEIDQSWNPKYQINLLSDNI